MSILIKGMEMPKNCASCYMFSFLSNSCRITNHVTEEMDGKVFDRRFDDCPIVELTPHGRLIDVDKVLDGLAHNLGIRSLDYLTPSERAIVSWFRDAQTVITASEEGM